jgi:hypothetical protein
MEDAQLRYRKKNREIPVIPSPEDGVTKAMKVRVGRICEKLGYDYDGSCWAHLGDGDDTPAAYLPGAVIGLGMAAGLMDQLGWKWEWSDVGLEPGWYKEDEWDPQPGEIMPNPKCLEQDDPHDLQVTLRNLETAIDIYRKQEEEGNGKERD